MEGTPTSFYINFRVYFKLIHFSQEKRHKNGQNVLKIGSR